MRYIILFLLFVSVELYAGELHIITDNGLKSYTECNIEVQAHSRNISEFWLDCADFDIITDPASEWYNVRYRTLVYISNIVISCHMDNSVFGQNNTFFVMLDCKDVIFKNDLEE